MDPILGSITLFAGTFAPQGWFDCQGQQLAINQYQALYSLLGTTYGGNGSTFFNLPDLRGRVAIGIGQGPGLPNYGLGQAGGTPTFTLTVANLPAHNHTATQTGSTASGGTITGLSVTLAASRATGGHETPNGGDYLATMIANGEPVSAYIASGNVGTPVNLGGIGVTGGSVSGITVQNGPITVGNTGTGTPVSNMQPYLPLRYMIAWEGIYPSRP